jgi:hypothetical protein
MTRARPSNQPGTRRLATAWAARLALFVAVFLLLMPGVAVGKARYFCARMERAVDRCCCPSASAAALPRAVRLTAELEAADCCQRLEGASARALVAAPQTFSDVALALIEPVPGLPSARRESRDLPESWGRTERPSRGPPLFIAHCALLL